MIYCYLHYFLYYIEYLKALEMMTQKKIKLKIAFLLQMTIYQFDAISTELAVMNPLFGMKGEAAKIIRTPMATMTLMQNYTNFFILWFRISIYGR